MTKQFVIHGVPTGKGRPRYANRGGFVTVYTPKETVDYEKRVQNEYVKQCGVGCFEKGVPVVAEIKAYYKIPKSTSKANTLEMTNGKILPIVKPDLDNVVKMIGDALNKVLYYDDSHIVEIRARKFYSLDPRVEVAISNY